MRVLWTFCAAILLVTMVATDRSLGTESSSNRLAALAAKKDLCDMICYARADGSISRSERITILMEAKEVLSHDEYLKFKKVLDRIAPPPPKKPSPSQLAKMKAMRKKMSPPQQPPVQDAVEPLSGPVLPAGAMLPDRMAPPVFFR
jgi:hypothetical protein